MEASLCNVTYNFYYNPTKSDFAGPVTVPYYNLDLHINGVKVSTNHIWPLVQTSMT